MTKWCIKIEDMEFYSYHGCFKEEQRVGNKFLVSVCLKTDCSKAAASDNLKDALNYQIAYDLIKKEMEKNSHLLENIAERILNTLFENFPQLLHAKVKVSKINPPMGGQIERVSVTLKR